MEGLEVLVSHKERVTIRVGEAFLKVAAEAWRTRREVDAIGFAAVPTPEILWHTPNAVMLSRVPGRPLGTYGEVATTSPAAWEAAGAAARRIHDHELPPWPGWELDDYIGHIERECQWLVDRGVVPTATVTAVRVQAEAALRPFTARFIHADLQPAHVFTNDDTVTGIIDWEDAEAGDPHFDIAVLTVGHNEHLDDVLRGYGAPLDTSIIRGWWAFRRLDSVRWMIEHGYDPTGDIAMLHHMAGT